jgi:hypothetical protein
MAKQSDNNDPVEFETNYRFRDWLPRPINKPNWKYLAEENIKPNLFTSIIYIGLGTTMLLPTAVFTFMSIYRFLESHDWVMIISSLLFGFFSFLGLKIITTPINQYINYKKREDQTRISPGRKKKQPKHRKDYK